VKTARLIVADSDHDANMLYATGIFVPDPFIYFEIAGKKHIVMSDLEFDRAKKSATVDRVLSLTRYQNQLKRAGLKAPRLSDIVNAVLHDYGVLAVEVPNNFPIGIAKKPRRIRVTVKPDPFFPERERKSRAEIRKLSHAIALAERGMAAAINALRMSRIARDGTLRWRGTKLTSEHLRGLANATIAGLGGTSTQTIIACGNQACDPHETGHGPLRAHQPIIIDIFPRDNETGYWGDITRTVVRGRASESIKRMYEIVRQAQQTAFNKLRHGVNGHEVHAAVQKLFRENGFETGRRNGRMRGFFHGTGHGLGLEIHETPRVSAIDTTLRAGNVVTVEPGLYYWGKGGVRLEDVVVIRKNGVRLLTGFPKKLEI
jgi:Xaa-Pro aminopeptidase